MKDVPSVMKKRFSFIRVEMINNDNNLYEIIWITLGGHLRCFSGVQTFRQSSIEIIELKALE